jgi:hypothetical protein
MSSSNDDAAKRLQPGLGRRTRDVDLLALAWSALVAVALFWLFGERGYDDPYITYRYAADLARGAGFVYNEGERILSTTTPLYTLILAAARLAGADIPLASNAIGCASLALGGLAFWRLGVAWRTRAVGLVGLLLYPFVPLLLPTLGGETALYNALVLFGFLAYARERYAQTAALLALATLTRADGALAAVVIGIDYLLHTPQATQNTEIRRRTSESLWSLWSLWLQKKVGQPPWRAIIVYVVLLAPWFLFAWAYFGAPLPATLAAKQRQGLMAISQGFLAGLLEQGSYYWGFSLYRPHFVLAAVGLIFGLARERRWLLIPAWSLLYIAAYTTLGVTSYFWYYGPVVPGIVALVGLGARVGARHHGPTGAGAAPARGFVRQLHDRSPVRHPAAGLSRGRRMAARPYPAGRERRRAGGRDRRLLRRAADGRLRRAARAGGRGAAWADHNIRGCRALGHPALQARLLAAPAGHVPHPGARSGDHNPLRAGEDV